MFSDASSGYCVSNGLPILFCNADVASCQFSADPMSVVVREDALQNFQSMAVMFFISSPVIPGLNSRVQVKTDNAL